MISEVTIYLSMASELDSEREALSQVLARAPVPFGWRILHTPPAGSQVDLVALTRSDLFLLTLGTDIRAPVGYELLMAMRSGLDPLLFRHSGILRTPAAEAFIRTAQEHSAWRDYQDTSSLAAQVEKLLAGHFLANISGYEFKPAEVERLQAWRAEIDSRAAGPVDLETRRALGGDGVIFSRERYMPSKGVLIQPPKDRPDPAGVEPGSHA